MPNLLDPKASIICIFMCLPPFNSLPKSEGEQIILQYNRVEFRMNFKHKLASFRAVGQC